MHISRALVQKRPKRFWITLTQRMSMVRNGAGLPVAHVLYSRRRFGINMQPHLREVLERTMCQNLGTACSRTSLGTSIPLSGLSLRAYGRMLLRWRRHCDRRTWATYLKGARFEWYWLPYSDANSNSPKTTLPAIWHSQASSARLARTFVSAVEKCTLFSL